jgi:hypothetical protein
MTNKIKLKAPTSYYNLAYMGKISLSDLKANTKKQIEFLQTKQSFLQSMLDQKKTRLTFARIKKVELVGAYVDYVQEQDHYGTKEELIVFQLHADSFSFLAGLHFVGNTSPEHCHYFMHVPDIDDNHYNMVCDAVLELTDFYDLNTVTINQA